MERSRVGLCTLHTLLTTCRCSTNHFLLHHTLTEEGTPQHQPDSSKELEIYTSQSNSYLVEVPQKNQSLSPFHSLAHDIWHNAQTSLTNPVSFRLARMEALAQRPNTPSHTKKMPTFVVLRTTRESWHNVQLSSNHQHFKAFNASCE